MAVNPPYKGLNFQVNGSSSSTEVAWRVTDCGWNSRVVEIVVVDLGDWRTLLLPTKLGLLLVNASPVDASPAKETRDKTVEILMVKDIVVEHAVQ
jgi:hypothetical protein